ncbi:hypothetical protein ROLI_025430 [Roseobacter fucihabitans]|uniref:Uncharacterized protein n=1 Tax=Roseobacter fucihabitans TaxID=1537242 RepID=A0ABZ2BVN5_9RHOB|nr:hypothetical protein [Roseobacter litoralis]MBC6967630.1 hypothetical protein [Roseobacter litoralis]
MEGKAPEIYAQRYETFRHLDKLRWQMLQLLIAVATGTALVLRTTTGDIEWWFYALVGFSLLVIAFVMFRIGGAIRGNAVVLQKAAVELGDMGIPDTGNKWKSVAYWLAWAVFMLGTALLLKSIQISFFIEAQS